MFLPCSIKNAVAQIDREDAQGGLHSRVTTRTSFRIRRPLWTLDGVLNATLRLATGPERFYRTLQKVLPNP